MKWGSFLITILLLTGTTSVKASKIQDLNSLKVAAESFALSKLMVDSNPNRKTIVTSGKLDPRLRLPACTEELITFIPPGSRLQGHSTIGIRCQSPKAWSIYIPIKVSIFEQAIVALQGLQRGQIISNSDITLDEVDISYLRGRSFTDKEKLIGTKLKSNIKANQVIDSASICLICKGDSVIITAVSDAISVTMAGKALNDGSRGDKIRVQNNASRRIVDAIITDVGAVKVGI